MSGGKDYSRREFMSKPLVYLARKNGELKTVQLA